MTSNQKTMMGFLAGIAAGVGIYAFLQSETGRELLGDLKDKAEGWKDDVTDMVDKGKAKANEWAGRGKQMATDVADKARENF